MFGLIGTAKETNMHDQHWLSVKMYKKYGAWRLDQLQPEKLSRKNMSRTGRCSLGNNYQNLFHFRLGTL
uniref:Uncharacterized protein n=1 Tax=Physcomitrium patens TaxID=3218 RepID=A0A2K1L009_PHYPA|nr:hypothetical protein PHYPA_002153 [Physcomitrium patens]